MQKLLQVTFRIYVKSFLWIKKAQHMGNKKIINKIFELQCDLASVYPHYF